MHPLEKSPYLYKGESESGLKKKGASRSLWEILSGNLGQNRERGPLGNVKYLKRKGGRDGGRTSFKDDLASITSLFFINIMTFFILSLCVLVWGICFSAVAPSHCYYLNGV